MGTLKRYYTEDFSINENFGRLTKLYPNSSGSYVTGGKLMLMRTYSPIMDYDPIEYKHDKPVKYGQKLVLTFPMDINITNEGYNGWVFVLQNASRTQSISFRVECGWNTGNGVNLNTSGDWNPKITNQSMLGSRNNPVFKIEIYQGTAKLYENGVLKCTLTYDYNIYTLATLQFKSYDYPSYVDYLYVDMESGAEVKCKVDGSIKTSSDIKVKVDGSWKAVEAVFSKIDGVWKSQ